METKKELDIKKETLKGEELELPFQREGQTITKRYTKGFRWTSSFQSVGISTAEILESVLSPEILATIFPLLQFNDFKHANGTPFSSLSEFLTVGTTYVGKQPLLEKEGTGSLYQVVALKKEAQKASVTIDQYKLGSATAFLENTVTLTCEKKAGEITYSITMRCTPKPDKPFSESLADKVVGQQPLGRIQRYFHHPERFKSQSKRTASINSYAIDSKEIPLALSNLNIRDAEGFTSSFIVKKVPVENMLIRLKQKDAVKELFHDVDKDMLLQGETENGGNFVRNMKTVEWKLAIAMPPVAFAESTQAVTFATEYITENNCTSILISSGKEVKNLHQLAFLIQCQQVGNNTQIEISTLHSHSKLSDIKEDPRLMVSLSGMSHHETFKRHFIDYVCDRLFPGTHIEAVEHQTKQTAPIGYGARYQPPKEDEE